MSKGATKKRWSTVEVAYLRLHYRTLSHVAMAQYLDRGEKAVTTKCHRLGLRKEDNPGHFQPGHGPLRTYGPLTPVGRQKDYFAPGPRESRAERSERMRQLRRPLPAPAPATLPIPPQDLLAGWTWTKGEHSRQATWHYFRGTNTLCGLYEIQDLTAAELRDKPAADTGKRSCRICQRILDRAHALGLPLEPGLSDEDKAFIQAHWQTKTAAQIAALLGRQQAGKVVEYAGAYCPRKAHNAGHFQKGQVPTTAKPDVSESIHYDKRGVPYRMVRGGKYGWQYKHKALWQQAHGPLPAGHVVAFCDGDTLNCVLENLVLRTRGEHLALNSGRQHLTDSFVSRQLARETGRKGCFVDKEMQAAVLQAPALLELKRNQLLLKRQLTPKKS